MPILSEETSARYRFRWDWSIIMIIYGNININYTFTLSGKNKMKALISTQHTRKHTQTMIRKQTTEQNCKHKNTKETIKQET